MDASVNELLKLFENPFCDDGTKVKLISKDHLFCINDSIMFLI